MSSPDKPFQVICGSCARKTNHRVLHEVTRDGEYVYYDETFVWQTIQCVGCDGLSFRLKHIDNELINEDEIDNKPTVSIKRFPPFIPLHRQPEQLWHVPQTVKGIYLETVSTLASGNLVLAGMGLRATLESVCNHLQIGGKSLDKRIDLLAKSGNISISDGKRLHAIRFMGNDAAHEILTAKREDLRVALSIIEHLINSVFILGKISENLETSVDSIEELIVLVERMSAKHEIGSLVSLASLLGRSARRLGDNFPRLEKEFESKVSDGSVRYYSLEQPGSEGVSPRFKVESQFDPFEDLMI